MNNPSFADYTIDPVTRHLERHTTTDGGNRVLVSGDVFSDDVSVECRPYLFDLTDRDLIPNLDWLLVTKHPENIMPIMEDCNLIGESGTRVLSESIPNLWLGTVVSNQAEADERIPHLLRVPAKVRFVVCNPVEMIDLSTWLWRQGEGGNHVVRWPEPFHWVIAAGETSPNARSTHPDWFSSLRDQCVAAGVPFWCDLPLDGREWREVPQ